MKMKMRKIAKKHLIYAFLTCIKDYFLFGQWMKK